MSVTFRAGLAGQLARTGGGRFLAVRMALQKTFLKGFWLSAWPYQKKIERVLAVHMDLNRVFNGFLVFVTLFLHGGVDIIMVFVVLIVVFGKLPTEFPYSHFDMQAEAP